MTTSGRELRLSLAGNNGPAGPLRCHSAHFQKKKSFSVERCPELAFSRHYRIYSGVWRSVVSTRKDGDQGRTGDESGTLGYP